MPQERLSKKVIAEAVAAMKKTGSKMGAARLLGVPEGTLRHRVAAADRKEVKVKMLLLDIETAPNIGHIWSLWNQNIGLKQLMESSYVMCWSAKWYRGKTVFFDSVYHSDPKVMLVQIHKMLDECDIVIHYNGTTFDIPTLNKEFVLQKMQPPSPYKQIDLLRTVRRQFRFPSNKLDYVAQRLGLGKKHEHSGHQLWVDCMAHNKKAWAEMKKYNIQDIVLLERVYERIKPWIKNHPNLGLYNADPACCPTCSSVQFQARGYAYTSARRYKRYRCSGCGAWFRGGYDGQARVFTPA